MKEYKIKSILAGEATKEVSLNWNGNSYLVIYGRYINGGFFCMPSWGCGGELASFNDVFWNAERIGKALHDIEAGNAIASAIARIETR